jgi:hypothetical protein
MRNDANGSPRYSSHIVRVVEQIPPERIFYIEIWDRLAPPSHRSRLYDPIPLLHLRVMNTLTAIFKEGFRGWTGVRVLSGHTLQPEEHAVD